MAIGTNTLLTISMITKVAVKLFVNSNAFIQNLDRQYDDQYARTGAKIGTALRIRLPNDYTVRTGQVASVQDTAETSTTLTLATQKGVDLSFSSAERTLDIDDYSERYLAPAINNLAGAVALDVMSGSEGGVCNFVSATDNSGNITTPTATTVLNARALLDVNSTPPGKRYLVDDPFTDARVTASLTGLFNPATAISQQYSSGMMKNALGFSWMTDQTVLKHTTGTYSAGNVSGASQTGTSITVTAITGTFKAGDIITFAAVYAVNRVTKQSTGALRQFVVTADVPAASTSIPIYPALIPAVSGNAVQYQTVTVSPADGATITLASKASEVYRKNIGYAPEAITMATADLWTPTGGVIAASRQVFDGVSLRIIDAYIPGTDQAMTRVDVLYGYLFVRPEWCVVIADAL